MIPPKDKKEGKALLEKGFALVDTSNRTKEVKEKSALALKSKKMQTTISLSSKEKKKIFPKLAEKHPPGRVPAIAHCVKLYYALQGKINSMPGVCICADGHNIGYLKHYLQNFLKEEYDSEKICILTSLKSAFGKRNIADKAARLVAREGAKPTLDLKESHFKKLGLL